MYFVLYQTHDLHRCSASVELVVSQHEALALRRQHAGEDQSRGMSCRRIAVGTVVVVVGDGSTLSAVDKMWQE